MVPLLFFHHWGGIWWTSDIVHIKILASILYIILHRFDLHFQLLPVIGFAECPSFCFVLLFRFLFLFCLALLCSAFVYFNHLCRCEPYVGIRRQHCQLGWAEQHPTSWAGITSWKGKRGACMVETASRLHNYPRSHPYPTTLIVHGGLTIYLLCQYMPCDDWCWKR